MLSYKEYKLLNESLYGAFNLGLKNPNVVGGIVSASSINGTEAALEAEAEEAIEEAKKMKKKMEDEEEEEADLEDVEKIKDDSEDSEDEDSEDEDSDEDSDEDEDEDEDEDSDEEDEDEDSEDSEMSKKPAEFMKKKMKKGCGKDCGCKKCGKYMSEGKKEDDDDSSDGLTVAQKKLPKALQDAILAKKGKKHKGKEDKEDKEDKDDDSSDGLTAAQKKLPKALQDAILAKKGKKKGDKEDKKCGKNMNEDEVAWWNSVSSMLGSSAQQNSWDGWSEVGEVQQALRENSNDPGALNTVFNKLRHALDTAQMMLRQMGFKGLGGANLEAIKSKLLTVDNMEDEVVDWIIKTLSQSHEVQADEPHRANIAPSLNPNQ